MSDPTLKRTSVTIKYTASDGYSQDVGYSSARASSPEAVLIEALEELARLTALFGFEDRALAAFNAARQRVFEWRATRDEDDPPESAVVEALAGIAAAKGDTNV
jgi:hypothetical protein